MPKYSGVIPLFLSTFNHGAEAETVKPDGFAAETRTV
jgi:hypothetical protein